ncbi:FmdB family zinc ribbon protein [Nocardiopsis kunsanensis]|uniref:FmdB family zinc ribbon protein n=1 Tax=Nocardiopsis kunsanensis TaxID=141693 RepID=UPI0018739B34|nr:FmdB family zinc ribbon protein [Nocardiopsis kunsanensis]
MAIYQFMCEEHGGLELEAAMGTAPPTLSCPDCGRQARRVFSAPTLGRTPRAVATAFERAERSADEPNVVTSLPPRSGRARPQRYTHEPTHQRLPRH